MLDFPEFARTLFQVFQMDLVLALFGDIRRCQSIRHCDVYGFRRRTASRPRSLTLERVRERVAGEDRQRAGEERNQMSSPSRTTRRATSATSTPRKRQAALRWRRKSARWHHGARRQVDPVIAVAQPHRAQVRLPMPAVPDQRWCRGPTWRSALSTFARNHWLRAPGRRQGDASKTARAHRQPDRHTHHRRAV